MKTSAANNLWAVLFGVVTILVISLGLSALAAALIGGGILPISASGAAAWGITVIASLLGALICAGKAGEKTSSTVSGVWCRLSAPCVYFAGADVWRGGGTALDCSCVCTFGELAGCVGIL